jgi:hypothetical protein
MRHDRNSRSGKAALIVIAGIAFLGIAYGGCVMSFRSDAVRAENGIVAQLDSNKASHDTMWKTIKETAQVSEMMRDDFIKVYESAMAGRYGENGSGAVMQWIQERNPQLSPEVYTNIQTVIEANRVQFLKDQQQLVDKVREYKNLLDGNDAILANAFLGFPRKIDPDDDRFKPITSGRTDDAFRIGKDDEIKLR